MITTFRLPLSQYSQGQIGYIKNTWSISNLLIPQCHIPSRISWNGPRAKIMTHKVFVHIPPLCDGISKTAWSLEGENFISQTRAWNQSLVCQYDSSFALIKIGLLCPRILTNLRVVKISPLRAVCARVSITGRCIRYTVYVNLLRGINPRHDSNVSIHPTTRNSNVIHMGYIHIIYIYLIIYIYIYI